MGSITKDEDDDHTRGRSGAVDSATGSPRSPHPDGSPHTPGPWRLGPTDGIGQVGRLRVVDANGVQVADCEAPKRPDNRLVFVRTHVEDEANARLVAAAPELLAALNGLINVDLMATTDPADRQHLLWRLEEAARAAIAKAEGR